MTHSQRKVGTRSGLSASKSMKIPIPRFETEELIIALMVRPRLMLIDEISEGLQPSVIERIADVLRHKRQANGTAMLLIEQNTASMPRGSIKTFPSTRLTWSSNH